jgi:hypothetical protein
MNNVNFWKRVLLCVVGALLFSMLIGALIPLVIPIGDYMKAWLAGSLITFIATLILILVWQRAGGQKVLFWMMLAAFLLRLVLGVLLTVGLPKFGYAEEGQVAGYLYSDSFRRDVQAWNLASSGAPLVKAFSGELVTDQYGGLLALSALVYRIFSPDAHRPYLVVIICSGISALGLPFLLSVARRFVYQKYALVAGWIMALFPETLFLGASQMREPFMITAFAVSFWAIATWFGTKKRLLRISGFFIGVLTMFIISTRSAVLLVVFLFIWLWIELSGRTGKKWIKITGWIAICLMIGVVFGFSWGWLKEVMQWDMLLAYRSSGWIELVFDSTPEWLHAPFIIVYGLFQPVLPAAIVDPAPWIWRTIGILRGVGWYALLPFLVYGFFIVWKTDDKTKKHLLIWLALAAWGWIILSSARAGGDQWDNPRYRMTLIPWMSLLVAYVLNWSKVHHSHWFWRWVIVEGIFLLFFTHWYISRYSKLFSPIPFPGMIALIIGLSGAVMIYGWLRDRKQHRLPENNQ